MAERHPSWSMGITAVVGDGEDGVDGHLRLCMKIIAYHRRGGELHHTQPPYPRMGPIEGIRNGGCGRYLRWSPWHRAEADPMGRVLEERTEVLIFYNSYVASTQEWSFGGGREDHFLRTRKKHETA